LNFAFFWLLYLDYWLFIMFHRRIYLDYASLTPIDRRVLSVMRKYSGTAFANPSSWYKEGVSATQILDRSRKTVAELVHAHADEITFTAGGTESNNLAIQGAVAAALERGLKYQDIHIVSTAIEHSSVLECLRALGKKGVTFDLVDVDTQGIIRLDDLKKKIRADTILVSVMTVNNEIGTIQPIREIAKIVRQARTKRESIAQDESRKKLSGSNDMQDQLINTVDRSGRFPLFHTDAAQGLYCDLSVEQLGVDLLTLDGSKMYGPRGIGCLYVKRNTPIKPIIFGGGQESGLRSGTENIPAIAGFATACSLVGSVRKTEQSRLAELRSYFIEQLHLAIPHAMVNGVAATDPSLVSPHILNISIPGIDSEFLVLQLDAKGIAVSTKSSCLRDEKESYVLKAIGAASATSLRFSFGRCTTKRQVVLLIKILKSLK
jgi:cysteine desulfurase